MKAGGHAELKHTAAARRGGRRRRIHTAYSDSAARLAVTGAERPVQPGSTAGVPAPAARKGSKVRQFVKVAEGRRNVGRGSRRIRRAARSSGWSWVASSPCRGRRRQAGTGISIAPGAAGAGGGRAAAGARPQQPSRRSRTRSPPETEHDRAAGPERQRPDRARLARRASSGTSPVEQFLVPQNIVRHIVVTVDNLPRQEGGGGSAAGEAHPGADRDRRPRATSITLSDANFDALCAAGARGAGDRRRRRSRWCTSASTRCSSSRTRTSATRASTSTTAWSQVIDHLLRGAGSAGTDRGWRSRR